MLRHIHDRTSNGRMVLAVQSLTSQTMIEYESSGWFRQVVMTCAFRFEEKPEVELIEIFDGHHTAHVCENCLALIIVHRRIHHMNIEKLLTKISES